VFTNANQFGGQMNIDEGTLNIQNGQALGGPQGATVVNYEASLQVQDVPAAIIRAPVQVVNETHKPERTGVSGNDYSSAGPL